MEFFEYLPESRPTQPDIPFYARMDYGNRVGFWRMLDVLNKHKVRACCCLNLELLDHLPEVKDAMIAADWHFVARISWAERLGLGTVEDHSPFGERDFAGRWSMLLSPQTSTGGKSG